MRGVILTILIQYISKSLYTDTEPPPCCKKWTGFYDTVIDNCYSDVYGGLFFMLS